MVGSTWIRILGSGLVAIGATVIVASSTSGARDRSWDPPPCPSPGALVPSRTTPGTSWRADPVIDDGTLVGRRVSVSAGGELRARTIDLDAESFAAGPFDGRVLVGTDDGLASTVSLIDPSRGCAEVIDRTSDVVRRATITPDRRALLEFRVDRASRADLGVFRVALDVDGGSPIRVVDPIVADDRFGPTWTTDFAWADDGRQLAIQSCGAIACRTRIVDQTGGVTTMVGDLGQGDMIGLVGGHLVVYESCGGLPCPILSIDIATGEQVVLDDQADQAISTVDTDGVGVVVIERGDDHALRAMDVHGGRVVDLPADPDGRRLLAAPSRSGAAIELPAGSVLLGPDGRLPLDGRAPPLVLRLADGMTLDLDEVNR
jgi:hypothetical protein